MKRYFCLILLIFIVDVSFSQTNFNKIWVTGGGYTYSSTFNIGEAINLNDDSFH